jgi:hypothetical protein
LTQEGLPVFERSLRALSCKLVSSAIPLHDLDYLEKGKLAWKGARDLGDMVISELFIGRVVRVERVEMGSSAEETRAAIPSARLYQLFGPTHSHRIGLVHILLFCRRPYRDPARCPPSHLLHCMTPGMKWTDPMVLSKSCLL